MSTLKGILPDFLRKEIKDAFPGEGHPARVALREGKGFLSRLQEEIDKTEDPERKKSLKHIKKQVRIAKRIF